MTWNNTENHAGAAKMLTYFRVSGFIPAVLYRQCMLQTYEKKKNSIQHICKTSLCVLLRKTEYKHNLCSSPQSAFVIQMTEAESA